MLDGGETLSCLFLPLGVLLESGSDLLLAFLNGGEPIVETCVLHLLLMVAHGRRMVADMLIMEAVTREGHASPLIAVGDILIGWLLVMVEVVVLPSPTRALLLGALRMVLSKLLPSSISRLGRPRLVPTYMH